MGGELRVVEVGETRINKKKEEPFSAPPRCARKMGGFNARGGANKP